MTANFQRSCQSWLLRGLGAPPARFLNPQIFPFLIHLTSSCTRHSSFISSFSDSNSSCCSISFATKVPPFSLVNCNNCIFASLKHFPKCSISVSTLSNPLIYITTQCTYLIQQLILCQLLLFHFHFCFF